MTEFIVKSSFFPCETIKSFIFLYLQLSIDLSIWMHCKQVIGPNNNEKVGYI
jgi:hypothetical protein